MIFTVFLFGCIGETSNDNTGIKQGEELKQQNIIDVYSTEILAFMGLKNKEKIEPVEPVKYGTYKEINNTN
jgi:hypothetical protein